MCGVMWVHAGGVHWGSLRAWGCGTLRPWSPGGRCHGICGWGTHCGWHGGLSWVSIHVVVVVAMGQNTPVTHSAQCSRVTGILVPGLFG